IHSTNLDGGYLIYVCYDWQYFYDFQTPPIQTQATEFAIEVTSLVIPNAFWGSEHNFEIIKKRLNLSEFDWAFTTPKAAGKKTHRPLSDTEKALALVHEFLYWYFESFLVPLLKTTFYCTESAAFKNQTLFFRQDDWKILCQPLIDKLRSDNFEKVSVRDYPREERQSHLQGASILSHDGIYTKLRAFKEKLISKTGRMYVSFLDSGFISQSYTKSKALLREDGCTSPSSSSGINILINAQESYTIQRYAQLHLSTGKVKRKWIRSAVPEDLAACLRQVVFCDQVVYSNEDTEPLLALLEEHITTNIVKVSNLNCGALKTHFPKGHPEYGCFVAKDKTVVNFPTNEAALSIPDQRGTLLNNDRSSVDKVDARNDVLDSGFLTGVPILELENTLTVHKGKGPGQGFRYRMLGLCRLRTHIIFTDTTFNSPVVVKQNIYEAFLLTAMKMAQYLKEWGLDVEKRYDFVL
ncbi:6886_t:CDS:10, partial [Acaulospora colombiana]